MFSQSGPVRAVSIPSPTPTSAWRRPKTLACIALLPCMNPRLPPSIKTTSVISAEASTDDSVRVARCPRLKALGDGPLRRAVITPRRFTRLQNTLVKSCGWNAPRRPRAGKTLVPDCGHGFPDGFFPADQRLHYAPLQPPAQNCEIACRGESHTQEIPCKLSSWGTNGKGRQREQAPKGFE